MGLASALDAAMLAGVTDAASLASLDRAPPLFNVPLHVAFADALAAGLLARCDGEPLALARALVLLPNRRAVTALTEAFVRQLPESNGGLLLPRMVPVGDLDDGGFDRLVAGDAPLMPAVSMLLRRFELARLAGSLPDAAGAAVERLRLGDALGEVLDALLAEEIEPESLRAAADGQDLADHWNRTLAYLELIIGAWPNARRGHGGTEGATRLTMLIDGVIARWQAAPPPGLVVAAGMTGPTPALVRLLGAVLRLPQGLVVLPGLDDDDSPAGQARWDAIALADPANPASRDDPGHPGWALKRLLGALGLTRADVQRWHAAAGALDGPPQRAAALLAALAPAAAGVMPAPDPPALDGLALAECATAAEEAQVAALALREALEVPGQRAALITPDPALARRVAAHCRRWGIAVDSSAGTPLALTPPGALALALVEAMAEAFAPARLLAVVKNSLAGQDDAAFIAGTLLADRALRGVRPPPGLEMAEEAITRFVADHASGQAATMAAWWQRVGTALQPLEDLREREPFSLTGLMAALRQSMTALTGDAGWAGPAGRQLAALVAEIETHGALFGPITADEAPALLAVLIGGQAVRVPGQGHPRLSILGPVEAQLTRADVVILAGLNEASWPGRPAPDPWLAPAIRARLGLPGTARAQGLAAQDFLRAASAPKVLITRARRDAGGPQLPSRLWLRLIAHFEAGGQARLVRRDDLVRLARLLDAAPAGAPLPAAPRPCPPLALRPDRISITELDTLIADPFAFHAKRILKLSPMDPLDQDPTPAMRGNLAHTVLERWVRGNLGTLDLLDRIASEELDREAAHFPLLAATWVPRMKLALRWAGQLILQREQAGWTRMLAEVEGNMTLANGIVLRGRIDRLDRHRDGCLLIADYKTGAPPAKGRVRALEANQLALGLAMAAAGKLVDENGQPIAGGVPGDIEYWQLMGKRGEPGKVHGPLHGNIEIAPADHVSRALAAAEELTTTYLQTDAPFLPKLRPDWSWQDYDHLARVAEWINRSERAA
jgi:ATP-dependent helicase/nuclease subunit B